MKRVVGPKKAITTLAIKKGLVCPHDGQIFNRETLEADLAALIEENNYSMSAQYALTKVLSFSEMKDRQAYS